MKLKRLLMGTAYAGWTHWCPGCRTPHGIYVEQKQPNTGAKWSFDGNEQEPTFSPSILCFTTPGSWHGREWVASGPRQTSCHYFIKEGKIEFLADCLHELKGQTVDLPDYPEPDSG